MLVWSKELNNQNEASFFCILKWFIGGAERLIVDAAVELVSHGHDVHIFTAHHDKNRCFEETVSGNLRLFSLSSPLRSVSCIWFG
jgi:hypothetical protein